MLGDPCFTSLVLLPFLMISAVCSTEHTSNMTQTFSCCWYLGYHSASVGMNFNNGPILRCQTKDATGPGCSLGNLQDLKYFSISADNMGFISLPWELCDSKFRHLQTLYLPNNNISLDNENFTCAKNLKFINMARNSIRYLKNNTFAGLYNLSTLDLRANKIQYIEPGTFSELYHTKLEIVYLQENKIMETDLWMWALPNIRRVNFTFNLLNSTINPGGWSIDKSSAIEGIINQNYRPRSMYFEHNAFTRFPPTVFTALFSERITFVDSLFTTKSYCFVVGYNPYHCDCYMYYALEKCALTPYVQQTEQCQQKALETITCHSPASVKGKNLTPKHFNKLSWEKHGDEVCGVKSNCPVGCQCRKEYDFTAIGVKSILIANCTNGNMTKLPDIFPVFDELILHLENNQLRSISERYYLERVTELYLDNNSISHIELDAVILLAATLKIFKIPGNKLSYLPENVKNLTYLEKIDLANNSFTCDCSIKWVKNWLESLNIPNIEDTTCHLQNEPKILLFLPDDDLCPSTKDTLLVSLIIAGISICCVLLFTLTIFKYRKEMKLLMYYKFGRNHQDVRDNNYRQFHVFISYSNHDYQWVRRELFDVLRNEYEVCIDFKDFLPGASIMENISNAIESSRHTILVLSRHFLQSEWCKYEFRAAHERVLKDKTKHIILICLENISLNEVDRELRRYLSLQMYLKHDDPNFRNKIFRELPKR